MISQSALGLGVEWDPSTVWFPPVGARPQLQRAQGDQRGTNLAVLLTLANAFGVKLPTEGNKNTLWQGKLGKQAKIMYQNAPSQGHQHAAR